MIAAGLDTAVDKALLARVGDGFDVVVAGSPSRIAPLLAALDADVAISAAFPMLIPADALDVPRLGIINTHPSLLPRYRGSQPDRVDRSQRRP